MGKAHALPQSMMMVTEMTASQGGQNVTAKATIWYSNKKFRTEVSSNMKVPQNPNMKMGISNKAVFLLDMANKVGYLLDSSTKTALKIDTAQVSKMSGGSMSPQNFTDPVLMSDPAKIKSEITKNGGKQVGKEKLFGHNCTIWAIPTKSPVQGKPGVTETVSVKIWLADGISVPLKGEVTSPQRGKVASFVTRDFKVNMPLASTLFSVPAGYKITNLADMFQNRKK